MRARRVWGWHLPFTRRVRGKAFEQSYFHFEPGYLFGLIQERPDAIISTEMGFRTLIALLYGWCFRKPVLVWWGGTVHTERSRSRLRKLFRLLVARGAAGWISYGQTSTEYLLTLGISRERILQIQNCPDDRMFLTDAKPAFEIQPKPVLLHVGRMVPLKGIKELLEAASRLQAKGLKFSVVLVGEGPDAAEMQRLASRLSLENVFFYPNQPQQAMGNVYCGADVLVFPTMDDVWGLVANEALLMGIPVLCSRYAGCAAELFDAESIFDPKDEDGFTSALRRAVQGQLPRPDRTRAKGSSEVGEMIVAAVRLLLNPSRLTPARTPATSRP